MIVSLHLPKCAGFTFRRALGDYFGERLYLDYGDWVGDETPEAIAHRAERLTELQTRLPGILEITDCIHGHFYASKSLDLLDDLDRLDESRFFTIFRDPFEAIPSGYAFLARKPHIDQPSVREFHETRMSLREYIVKWQNPFSTLIAPLGIEDFRAIGMASAMPETVDLFNATFETEVRLPPESFNVNPEGSHYSLDPDERRLIEHYHEADIELWDQARERFRKDLRAVS